MKDEGFQTYLLMQHPAATKATRKTTMVPTSWKRSVCQYAAMAARSTKNTTRETAIVVGNNGVLAINV